MYENDMFARFPEPVWYMKRIKDRQAANDRKFATKEIFWEEFFCFINAVVNSEIEENSQKIANRFKYENERQLKDIKESIENVRYYNNNKIDLLEKNINSIMDYIIKQRNKKGKPLTKK